MPIERIDTLRRLMLEALALRGVTGTPAELLTADYLGAQLEGKPTHGLSRFLLIDNALAERGGPPEVVRRTPASALIDGRRELGQLAAHFCIDVLTDLARQTGIAVVGMFNASRYGRLAPYGQRLAEAGLVGILMNGAGSPVVVPHAGAPPLIGTNPICFAFPGAGDGLVFDFATSQRSWSEIWQATVENRALPGDAFLDSEGNVTQDPKRVFAALPFGGAKGFALGLAIEVLAGALVTARMGPAVETQYDLGFLFIALDPALFTTTEVFRSEVETLAVGLRASGEGVRLPGDRARDRRRQAESSGEVDVDGRTLARLVEMSQGVDGRVANEDFLA